MTDPDKMRDEEMKNANFAAFDLEHCGKMEKLILISKGNFDEALRAARKEAINGETSDGYHTFNELYEHRVLLWINLCLLLPKYSYVIEEHFEGWFLLGMETEYGQISYHCPNKYLELINGITRRSPEFDGHKSQDVIERLTLKAHTIRQSLGGKP